LKSWIQAHYAERVLTCWQAEMPEVHRIDLTVRTAMRCVAPTKESLAPADQRRAERPDGRPVLELRATAIAPVSASHGALGGSALKAQTALAFKEALRGIDVLVIDDLQFLQGKSTQAEFCHTLNALIDAGRQVVIAADRPPSDLESLDDRVRSRLAGGLVVEMGSLGEELRLGILKSCVAAARAHHASFDVPD